MRSAMSSASSHGMFLLAASVAMSKNNDIWLARRKLGAHEESPLSDLKSQAIAYALD